MGELVKKPRSIIIAEDRSYRVRLAAKKTKTTGETVIELSKIPPGSRKPMDAIWMCAEYAEGIFSIIAGKHDGKIPIRTANAFGEDIQFFFEEKSVEKIKKWIYQFNQWDASLTIVSSCENTPEVAIN